MITPVLFGARPGQNASELIPGPDIQPRRILVIDDNVEAAKSLGMLLEALGHPVDLCYDGTAGLEAARRLQHHLIFLDLALPGMDGYEVARQLRQDPAFDRILIVAVTGFGQEEDRQRTRDAGIDYHLVKPVDPAFLESLLGRRR